MATLAMEEFEWIFRIPHDGSNVAGTMTSTNMIFRRVNDPMSMNVRATKVKFQGRNPNIERETILQKTTPRARC